MRCRPRSIARCRPSSTAGRSIDPDIVAAQTRGALAQGLSVALYEKVTIKNGLPEQHNFDAYPVMRLHAMPTVDVYTVPSTAPPTGIGEPALPGIAPAVGNAIFARHRQTHPLRFRSPRAFP